MRELAVRALKTSARAADRVLPKPRGLVVLIYHRVGGGSASAVDLPLAAFEEQMELLARSGRVVTLDDGLAAVAQDRPSPRDPVVVTFDDGTADFAEHAMPVLDRHQIPVTLYVATEFLTAGTSFPGDAPPLTWGALRDACSTGLVTVGSHTHRHLLLDRLAPGEIDDELDRSCAIVAEQIGAAPAHFAYPKAVLGSAAAQDAIRARFRSAAVAGTRVNPYGRTDPYRLARSPIQVLDGVAGFRAKASGGMRLEDDVRRAANRWRYRGATG